ncbi:hypothetical protein RJ639_039756 [Escallonia herrerae]|uniref:Chromo domain-containing protein n=1 Tax=Escallonia herrerae TaxID=1293975 RepID=A0AA88WKS9_9ASTE|nr:hypothetical protein RJ639_039756 [Escallonia herrerae]
MLKPFYEDTADPSRGQIKRQGLKPKAAGKRVAEAILNDRVITASRKRHQEHLVKWQGYMEEENTWERAADLLAYNDKIEAYHMQKLTRASTALVGENVTGCPLHPLSTAPLRPYSTAPMRPSSTAPVRPTAVPVHLVEHLTKPSCVPFDLQTMGSIKLLGGGRVGRRPGGMRVRGDNRCGATDEGGHGVGKAMSSDGEGGGGQFLQGFEFHQGIRIETTEDDNEEVLGVMGMRRLKLCTSIAAFISCVTLNIFQERQKEKKRKKERDGETREGKDKGKKDKDKKERSKEKHRDKKERKEKQKDKRDKRKDKEKKGTSNDSRTAGPAECSNGSKMGSSCIQGNESDGGKLLLQTHKRLKDDAGANENCKVQKITLTGQTIAELPGKSNTGNLAEENEKFKDQGEDGNVHATVVENGSLKNFIGSDQRKIRVAGLVDKCVEKRMEEKEKKKHKNRDGRGDGHKDRDGEKKSKSKDKKRKKEKENMEKKKEEPCKEQVKPRESSSNVVDSNNAGIPYSSKIYSNGYNLKGNPGKRKGPDGNGFLHEEEIPPKKLLKAISSSHQIVENGRKLESCKITNQFAPHLGLIVNTHKVNNKNSSCPDKEKKLERCSAAVQFASEWQGTGTNHKVNSKVASSKSVQENRNIEPCETVTQLVSGRQGVAGDLEVEKEEHSINGWKEAQKPNVCSSGLLSAHVEVKETLIPGKHGLVGNHEVVKENVVLGRQGVVGNHEVEKMEHRINSLGRQGGVGDHELEKKERSINGLKAAQDPNICSSRPSSAPQVKEKIKASKRPPHPDSKYLSEILTVPKVEWSDSYDQEWLFASNDVQVKKPRLCSSQVDEAKVVWAEALRIEFADVTALPYHIQQRQLL